MLEAENQDMVNEMKQIQMAKQESERKRKQAEQQNAEINMKLQDLERLKGDQGDKVSKQTSEIDSLSSQLELAETKSIQLGQKNASLEAQMADAQVSGCCNAWLSSECEIVQTASLFNITLLLSSLCILWNNRCSCCTW